MSNKQANRDRARRSRTAADLGLIDVRLWVEPKEASILGMIKDCTEAMIDKAINRKFGDDK